jgi:single-strand DNA-binding protein
MASFNKVLLMGNMTRDPQLRYLPSQTPLVEFGLACNRRWRTPQGEDREEVTFVECTAFGKPAEIINQYCQKGKPIFIEGRLKFDTWEDKQGGGKRSKLSVVVENFQFLGGRGEGGAGGSADAGGEQSQPSRSAPAGRGAPPGAPKPDATPPIGEEEHFKDNDIPF